MTGSVLVLIAALQAPSVDPSLTMDRARQELRSGHLDSAEAQFRAALSVNPADVDARIGLGTVLTRRGDWRGALDLLIPMEREAGENGDYCAALARAFRRAGDDRRAYEFFRRAVALSGDDPELRAGYENAAMAYGHAVAIDGFGQQVSPGSNTQSGTLAANARLTPRLHLLGLGRVQSGDGYTDAIGGAALQWRAGPASTVTFRATGGSGNTALANLDIEAAATHYTGPFEIGGAVREITFDGSEVTAVSPTFAWDRGERWRVDTRYTYSHSRFDATNDSNGDHSILLRPTFRATRRVWFNGAYAYGIESFEDLTVDRLRGLGAHTAAGGMRVALRSLTVVNGTWEHQWRSNHSRLDRFTVSLVQYIP